MNQNPDSPSADTTPSQGNGCAESPDDAGGEPPPGQAERPARRCHVELNLLTDDTDPPLAGWLDEQLARIAEIEQVSQGCLAVTVVDDRRMVKLNGQYKERNETTDVLAFDLRSSPADPIEADLVICRDEAARQASARGHDIRLELLLYAVHGLLHVLGYDDADPDAAAIMHQREDQLLASVGLAPAYAGRPLSARHAE